jgi:hypothetical protein
MSLIDLVKDLGHREVAGWSNLANQARQLVGQGNQAPAPSPQAHPPEAPYPQHLPMNQLQPVLPNGTRAPAPLGVSQPPVFTFNGVPYSNPANTPMEKLRGTIDSDEWHPDMYQALPLYSDLKPKRRLPRL